MNLRPLRVLPFVPLVLSSVFAQDGVMISRWVGPPGSRPGTYQEWISEHPSSELRVAKVTRQAGPNRDHGTVAVICESTLAAALAPELNQYSVDLQGAGYEVLSYAVNGGTPAALRALLQSAYHTDHILGALLIGNLPVAWFQVNSVWEPDRYAEWPIDLFFMDLDGTWQDSLKHDPVETLVPGHDGIYDSHTGTVAPEIFIGRLMTSGIGDSIELLRSYFRKNSAFRHGGLVAPQRALVFVDDDWHDWAEIWNSNVGFAFPDRTFYKDQESTRAEVYRRNLDSARTWVSVFAHSSSHSHGFYFDQHRQMDYYHGSDYTNQDPPALFYNHFACSFGRFTDTGYGGGRSIFASRYGLGAVATTKAGGMLHFENFYLPLGQGAPIGEAFRRWFSARIGCGISPEGLVWSYGMTLLGDPFLEPVRGCDAAVVRIVLPTGTVDSGVVVTPQAVVRNYGSTTCGFPVVLRIGSAYYDAQLVSRIAPGESLFVTFRPWTASHNARYALTCSTELGVDCFPGNDALRETLLVCSVVNAGVDRILCPYGTATTGSLTPKAGVHNFSSVAETFDAWFRIRDSLGYLFYQDSSSLNMGPECSRAVPFQVWDGPHALGRYTATCRVSLAGDRNPENDSAGAAFRVTLTETLPPGWSRQCSVPAGFPRKRVKSGGSMASGDGTISLLKGIGSNQLYQYNSWANAWQSLETLPSVAKSGKKRGIKRGCSLAWVDGRLFAIKDGKLAEFWAYVPDSACTYPWVERRALPPGPRAGGGSCLAAVTFRDTPYVFASQAGTACFFRYNCRSNRWWTAQHATAGDNEMTFSDGCRLAYDEDLTIYALFAKTNQLLAYDIRRDTWVVRASLPVQGRSGKVRKVKPGSGLAAHGGMLFASKGGNTNELWMYDCASDQWSEFDSLPQGPARKRIKQGSALVYDGVREALYATKGGNTLEFWAYPLSRLGLGVEDPLDPKPSGALRIADCGLQITPSPFSRAATISYSLAIPGSINLTLYDATGRLVTILASGHQSAGTRSFVMHRSSLAAGIYLLRLVTGGTTKTTKVILE